MRTRNSVGYENQTLAQIAATIAAKYGITLIAADGPSQLVFGRVTQRQETDLVFLHRLARDNNYDFTIRGKQLVFYSRAALEASEPVAAIARKDVMRFAFHQKTHRVYKAAQVSYQLGESKVLLINRTQAAPATPTGDTLKIVVRCENGQQASLKAASALHEANMLRTTASFTTGGETVYTAGNNITVSGFGVNDGKYLVEKARHRLDRATGYTTEFEARRVG
jgi:phage protein D